MSFFRSKDRNPSEINKEQFRPAIFKADMHLDRPVEGGPSGPTRRINLKVLVVLVVLVVLAPLLFFTLATVQDGQLRRQALEQATRAAEQGDLDKALLALDHYLKNWPDDVPGLELTARLRSESPRTLDELMLAADAQDHLLRVDPMGPDRQKNRRKLVELYVRWSEGIRQASSRLNLRGDKTESRSRAAVKIAEQILSLGADDAESHRLLAMALESLAATGDTSVLAESTKEYEKALRRDPGDVVSAERLAQIVHEQGHDLIGSDEILAGLVRANPKSVAVRLARYRFFAKTNRFDRARLELENATKLAPTDALVRRTAALEAIQRRDTVSARRHLEAIAGGSKGNQQVAMLWGFVDLAEKHPDFAVDVWRNGLLRTAGTDRDLTWRLAYTLIQLGRFAEAEPLVAQYGRLSGEHDPMLHLLKGIQHQRLGRPSAAIAELKGIVATIDKAWVLDLALALGHAYETIHDDSLAMIEYRRALKESPRSLNAWRSVARLVAKDNPDSAAVEIEAALVQLPGEPSLYLDLAMIRLNQQLARPSADRNWSKVDEVLDRASKAGGRPDPDLIKVRAEILFAKGRPDEALGLLEKALEGPDRARGDLWQSWANGLANRGRIDEALNALERGSAPDKAGDHASLRIARANLLLQLGRGRAAREALTKGVETLPSSEQVELANAKVKILQILGDKVGAREACRDWARLAPLDSDAGLALLDLSQKNGDEEAAKLGLEVLRSVGGEDEPYALAARALDLLQSNRVMPETNTVRLEKAAELSHKLSVLAPKLPVSHLIRGLILERNYRMDEAIADYKVALEGDTAEMALARLTDLLSRLKRFDDLAALKKKLNPSIAIDQFAARMAIDQGDKEGAEKVIDRLVESQPDDPRILETQARFLRELGKPEAAEEALRALVDRVRDRPDAWVALVMFQVGQGNVREVAKTIERVRDDYHGERPDLLMARLRWVAGDRDAAAKLYDEALASHPDDLMTYQAAINLAESAGHPDRAEALARRALLIPSCSAWAARTLAMMLSKRRDPAAWKEAWALVAPGGPGAGDTPGDRLLRGCLLILSPEPARRAEAMASLTALIEDLPPSNPVGVRARVNLATALLQAGKLAEAARFIAEATEESVAADPTTLALAVEILVKAGKPDEAEQRLSRLAAIEPDSPRAASSRALVFQARGKMEEAVATIEDAASAAEKAPDGAAKHLFLANQLLNMKQTEAAGRLARKMALLWPRDAWILAEYHAKLGRTDEALDACRVAVDAGATREPLAIALGLVNTGRLDRPQGEKARAIAETVVAGPTKDAGVMLLAVAIASRQGRYDEALRICRRAFEADPSNPLCLNGLNDLAWIFCEELARPAEALVEVDRVLKVAALPTAMDTRGVILTRLGRFDEATDQLERGLQKEPVGHRYLHLARAYQKAGKPEKYQNTLDRAKKAGINPAALGPKEREEFAAVIGR